MVLLWQIHLDKTKAFAYRVLQCLHMSSSYSWSVESSRSDRFPAEDSHAHHFQGTFLRGLAEEVSFQAPKHGLKGNR